MINSYAFTNAKIKHIEEIANIEKQYFSGYSRAFDITFLTRWYQYNADMFYVVTDTTGEVRAFLILVPVTEALYKKLIRGEISDLFDFSENEVLKNFASEYYYIADICVSKRNQGIGYLVVASQLIKGFIKLVEPYAKYIVTSPITKDGVRLCEKIGFEKVSEEVYEGNAYPVCRLECNSEIRKRYRAIVSE